MEDRSVEIVRAVYEASGRGDVQAVLGALSNELEWYEAEGMPYGGLYRLDFGRGGTIAGPGG